MTDQEGWRVAVVFVELMSLTVELLEELGTVEMLGLDQVGPDGLLHYFFQQSKY